MKVIFLDVDGVLNTPESKSRIGNVVGIDDDKIKRLKRIADATAAKIVLVSTWKNCWVKDKAKKYYQTTEGYYLDEKLEKFGLEVFDKTDDTAEGIHLSRGEGISEYNYKNKVKEFVILDDLQFDYDGCGLTDNLVKVDGKIGLTDYDATSAVNVLNGK